jgi:hypothetical protein
VHSILALMLLGTEKRDSLVSFQVSGAIGLRGKVDFPDDGDVPQSIGRMVTSNFRSLS